jgi:hypothetical protein
MDSGGAACPTVLVSQQRERGSGDVLDDLDQLVEAVALAAGENDELPRSLYDHAAFGRSYDRDAATATELEQTLVGDWRAGFRARGRPMARI